MSEVNEVNPEIMEWARSQGSERLRKGIERGYPMTPLIYIEWAAAHYPGFVLDVHNEARWKSSECPSKEALALEEQYAAQPNVAEAFIVRATHWPMDYDGDEPMMNCVPAECLVVRDRRLKIDLVKHISLVP